MAQNIKKVEKKELLDALAEHGKAISEQQKAIETAVAEAKAENAKLITELKGELAKMEEAKAAMQKQLDELDIEIQKARKEPSESVKTFAQELREQLTKEAENLVGIKNGGKKAVKELQFQVKTFLETATASITTGSLLPIPQFEAGVSKAPDRMPFILDIIQTGVANSLTVYWTQRKTRTDNSGWVTEGTQTTLEAGTVTESVLGYETKNATMQNLLAFIKVSNNSIDDIDWLMSEIQTELLTLMALKLDAALLSGTTAVNGFNGILTGATAFSAGGDKVPAGATANKYDALKFAITQIKKANFRPNYIILNPSDVRDMELERDDRGAYLLPPFMQSLPGVGGVRVIENNGMTAGTYLVGDFTKAKFWMRKGMDLKIWDQNEDDAEKMLKTVTLYMRGTLVVKENDAAAFVTDTFAASIAEITNV